MFRYNNPDALLTLLCLAPGAWALWKAVETGRTPAPAGARPCPHRTGLRHQDAPGLHRRPDLRPRLSLGRSAPTAPTDRPAALGWPRPGRHEQLVGRRRRTLAGGVAPFHREHHPTTRSSASSSTTTASGASWARGAAPWAGSARSVAELSARGASRAGFACSTTWWVDRSRGSSRSPSPVSSPGCGPPVAASARIWVGLVLCCGAAGCSALPPFSARTKGIFNAYYTVALAPAVAAVAGAGAVALWRLGSERRWLAFALPAAVVGSAVWATALLARSPGYAPGLATAISGDGRRRRPRDPDPASASGPAARPGRWLGAGAGILASLALLAGPLAYSVTSIQQGTSGPLALAGPPVSGAGV